MRMRVVFECVHFVSCYVGVTRLTSHDKIEIGERH